MLRREISMKTPRCASIRSCYVYLYARAIGGRKDGWILIARPGLLEDFLMQKLFQKVYPSSHPKSAHYQCVPSVGGQDDNSRFRFFTLDCYHRLQAAHLRHLDVHQNHIRTICSKLL